MTRRFLFFILLTLTLISGQLMAGKIFGDIKMGDKPLPEGVRVTLTAPFAAGDTAKPTAAAAITDSAKTDKFGAYTLKAKGEGKCQLTIYWEKQPVTIEVYSFAAATRYDLLLDKKENKFFLKRR